MDGRNCAPPKKPWNDASRVNTMVSYGFKVVQDFVHPQYEGVCLSSPMQSKRTCLLDAAKNFAFDQRGRFPRQLLLEPLIRSSAQV